MDCDICEELREKERAFRVLVEKAEASHRVYEKRVYMLYWQSLVMQEMAHRRQANA